MPRRSLRLRLLVTFGLSALVLSSLFASLTYFGVRHVLVGDQHSTDLREGFVNAALIRSTLYASPPALPALLNSIEQATTSNVLVRTHNQWLSRSRGAVAADVPAEVLSVVDKGHAASETIEVNGSLLFVVGVPVPAVETRVFEIFQLDPLEHTLRVLLLLLTTGALAVSLIGLGAGLWVSRRAVRPLERVSRAAALIAEGELTTRLPVTQADREVQALTESFNAMVSRLVERMERDARFASDVSHELRSPLTTLTTTASVLQAHRDELSPAAQESLDLLVADLEVFRGLVEDLLEIARSDAGATTHVIETVPAVELVRQSVRSAAQRHGLAEPEVVVAPGSLDARVAVDRRRFERVMTNLIVNAHQYGGGAVTVRVTNANGSLTIDVDDSGTGIAVEEREQVFQRFFRGRAAHDRSMARGTGLGLALVRDHVTSFAGTIVATESPEGGARFEIVLPVREEAPA
ncbi:MAG: HAMP domain-containing sensor histidine kinase [Acidimicrobiales bacterium]